MPGAIASLVEGLGSLFFPAHCAGCGCAVEAPAPLCATCATCAASVARIKPPRCEVCSQPFDGRMAEFTCPNCQGESYAFECAVAVVKSRGVVREMIHRLKYGRELWLAAPIAGWMREGLGDPRLAGWRPDALVPVPLHPRRLREREFNQAEVLAGVLSRETGIPVLRALTRARYTTTQTRLDRQSRRQNLRNAFIPGKNIDVTDRNLLLVDDVLTTGSTLDACAASLLEAGAFSVRALTAARG